MWGRWAAGWCLAFEKCFICGEDVVWIGSDLLGIAAWSSSAKVKAEVFFQVFQAVMGLLWHLHSSSVTQRREDTEFLHKHGPQGLLTHYGWTAVRAWKAAPARGLSEHTRTHRCMHGAGSWNAKAFLQREGIPVQPSLVIAAQCLRSSSLLKSISLKSEVSRQGTVEHTDDVKQALLLFPWVRFW